MKVKIVAFQHLCFQSTMIPISDAIPHRSGRTWTCCLRLRWRRVRWSTRVPEVKATALHTTNLRCTTTTTSINTTPTSARNMEIPSRRTTPPFRRNSRPFLGPVLDIYFLPSQNQFPFSDELSLSLLIFRYIINKNVPSDLKQSFFSFKVNLNPHFYPKT